MIASEAKSKRFQSWSCLLERDRQSFQLAAPSKTRNATCQTKAIPGFGLPSAKLNWFQRKRAETGNSTTWLQEFEQALKYGRNESKQSARMPTKKIKRL